MNKTAPSKSFISGLGMGVCGGGALSEAIWSVLIVFLGSLCF